MTSHSPQSNLTINTVRNYSQAIPNDDCDDIVQFGLYNVSNTTENAVDANAGNLVISATWDINTMVQLFFDVVHDKIYFRTKKTAPEYNWEDWVQIALATPPQEFDLPLVDGVVHYEPSTKSTYSKSQEGLVVVHFYCKKADGTDIVQNDTIAMLPEGFHPSANVHIPANVSFDGGGVYSQDVATAVADPTGRVWIAFPPAGCKAVTTTLVFYAAS